MPGLHSDHYRSITSQLKATDNAGSICAFLDHCINPHTIDKFKAKQFYTAAFNKTKGALTFYRLCEWLHHRATEGYCEHFIPHKYLRFDHRSATQSLIDLNILQIVQEAVIGDKENNINGSCRGYAVNVRFLQWLATPASGTIFDYEVEIIKHIPYNDTGDMVKEFLKEQEVKAVKQKRSEYNRQYYIKQKQKQKETENDKRRDNERRIDNQNEDAGNGFSTTKHQDYRRDYKVRTGIRNMHHLDYGWTTRAAQHKPGPWNNHRVHNSSNSRNYMILM